MALFIVSRLPLLTLLLLAMTHNELKTHATPEPDDSVQYGEFCLRISDQSHWTSSKPVTKLPTESTNQEPYTSTQQTPTHLNSAPQPETTTQKDHKEVVTQKITAEMPPAGELVSSPCRCEGVEENLGSEVPQFRSLMIENPTATCSAREFIMMMSDGRKVCLTKFAAGAYLNNKFGRTNSRSSTLAPQNPNRNSPPGKFICINCPDGKNFDPEDVKAVEIMASLNGCPAMVLVTMRNKAISCIDSAQPRFKILLEKLEI
ncbi:putative uncharacterized protein DDB_G0290521 [Xyrichtys novacula]|uniref:Uncharacterized protein n=1 Tax=Xyrichtys novacula TaxID=13765 RepID=A0AAV1HNI2_XYRNO|nr:putative uncharacterized protein DDB_G0290521 [Xyrichtys novacula]